ncbi:MAG: 3'-5' exonuclease, partial [Myxococcota bacterium]|nr:3'-5' exonuclease [Myxococcota bacterium]
MANVGDHTGFGHAFQALCASKPHNSLPAITLVETRSRTQLESELLDNIALAQQDGTDLNNIAILCERQASARRVRQILTRANIPYKSARSIDPRGPWSSILVVWAEVCRGGDFDERSEERIRFVLAQRGMNSSEIDETVEWARRTTAQLGADSDFQNAPTPFVAAVSMVYELAWLKPANSSRQNRPDIDAFLACARANAHAAAWTSRADLWRSYRVVYEALREALMEGKPIRPDTFDQDIGDGIRVSTIHQSKGTEFDVVIAFDASVQWDPPDAAQHLRLLDELEQAFGDVEFRPSPESEEAQSEALWFVALTRARHAFVALTTPKKSLVSQLSDLDENGFAKIRSS